MALLQPPITGDPQLDSWTLRLTQQINQGLAGGTGGGSGGGGGSGAPGTNGTNGINSATIYLYQRVAAPTDGSVPPAPTLPLDGLVWTYETSSLSAQAGGGDLNTLLNGWSLEIPSGSDDYLFVIVAVVSDSGSTDTINRANWGVARLLSVPADDGESSITINIISNEGNIFRNAVGPDKILTAFVFDNGTGAQVTSGVRYTWFRGDGTVPVRVTSQTNRTVVNAGGVIARDIDPQMDGFPSITLDAGDVNTQETFTCEVEVI